VFFCRYAAIATLAAAVAVAPASASFPGQNGRIFFSSVRKDGAPEIFSMLPDGTAVTRLTRSQPLASEPAWSPDGKRIAFLADPRIAGPELWVMKRDATGLVRLARDAKDPAWSPDGRRLAFVCPARDHDTLCVIRSNGNGRRRITRPQAGREDSSPTWSPDGKEIAFAREDSPTAREDIFALNLRTGKVRPLTRTPRVQETSPSWSLRGWIAYDEQRGHAFTISVVKPDGSRRHSVTRGTDPSWSPDGKRIVFTDSLDFSSDCGIETALFVIDGNGTDRHRLAFDAGECSSPMNAAWSPDGGRIALDDARGGIWLVDSDGTGLRPLLRGDWGAWTPAVTADGSTVGFNDPGKGFFLMNVDGTNLRAASGGQNASWAPDGRRVADENDIGIALVNVDGSGWDQILEDEGIGDPSKFQPAWSPDGAKIAYVEGDGDGYISVFSLAGRKGRVLTRAGNDFEPAWSPNGQKIAFDHGKGIAVMNADGSRVHRLIRNGSQPAWSPDGKRIAFVHYVGQNSEIYVVNVNGTGLRRLTRNPGADLFPEWQPLR
jgi:TolB protein